LEVELNMRLIGVILTGLAAFCMGAYFTIPDIMSAIAPAFYVVGIILAIASK